MSGIQQQPRPITIDGDDSADVLDTAAVAALLGVGKDAVYASVARREIPHQRVGRHLRFSRAAVMRWLEACGPQGATKGR